MILNEKEVQTCLLFFLDPVFKDNDILVKESKLSIDEVIYIQAHVMYQKHQLDLVGQMTIDYRDGCICFENIQGHVEYLFLKLSIINLCKQFIKDESVKIKDNAIYFEYALPIEKVLIEKGRLNLILKES